jgi:hypothetical protein
MSWRRDPPVLALDEAGCRRVHFGSRASENELAPNDITGS